MTQFTVKSHIQHDGDTYEPGDTIELTNKQAKAAGSAVAPAKAEKPASKEK